MDGSPLWTLHSSHPDTSRCRERGHPHHQWCPSGRPFRTHQCLVCQRTRLIDALRGHLAEFGLVAPKGPASLKLLENALGDGTTDLPDPVRKMGTVYLEQIANLTEVIERLADELEAATKTDEELPRPCTIPGIGPVTAGAVAAVAPDLDTFDSGRNFAAWLGLVPRQRSTGGKTKLGAVEPRRARPTYVGCSSSAR